MRRLRKKLLYFRKRKFSVSLTGFTLIEVLLVMAIMLILLSSGASLLGSRTQEKSLEASSKAVIDHIAKARNYASTGYFSDAWGVKVLDDDAECFEGGDCIVVFKGETYAARNSAYDSIFDLKNGVSLASGQENEFYFSSSAGWLSTTTDAGLMTNQAIILNNNAGQEKIVVVYKSGLVSLAEANFLINSCVPITISNLTAGIGTSDPQDTASVTATAGRVLYLTVGMSFSGGFPEDSISISGLGATWTKISTNTYEARRRVWLFKGVSGSGNGAVTIDYTGAGTPQEIGWVLDEATGLDLATPNDSVLTTTNNGESITVSTGETPGTCDVTYSSLILENQKTTNVEAGWSSLGQTSTGSLGVRKVASAWDDAADVSHTWSWTGADGAAAFITILNSESN